MKRRRSFSTIYATIAGGALALASCEVPTEIPDWDTTWSIPISGLELSVASLLPGSVSITPDGNAFAFSVDGVQASEQLGDFCPECRLLGGVSGPKPAFSLELRRATPLPQDLISATVVGGEIHVELSHDLGFDPIRPGADVVGSITVVLRSAGDTLALTEISGEEEAFPSGTTKEIRLALLEKRVQQQFEVSVHLDSPEGDLVFFDNSASFALVMQPSTIETGEAVVRMQPRAVDLDATEFGIVGGEGLVNRIQAGVLQFEVENPFEVTGALDLVLRGADMEVSKQIQLTPGTSASSVTYAGWELRPLLLEEEATLSVSGLVSAAGESITIRPDQVIRLGSRFELTIATKEQ